MKTLAEINAAIAKITKSGAALDQLIQDTAVACVHHFAEHKDTGLVNRLWLALPKGSRKTALASWLLAYVAVVPNTNADTKSSQPFVYAKDKTTNPEGAAADQWFNHKPEKAVDEVFDLQKAIKMIIAKAGKASTLKGGDRDTLLAIAKLGGVPESDVTTKHAKTEAQPS